MKLNQDGVVGKTILIVTSLLLLFVVVLPLIGAGLGIISLPFHRLNAKVNLNHGVITQTYDTQFCLSNYEWFKNTYNDIQQTQVKIQNSQDQLDQFNKDYPDKSKLNYAQQSQYNDITTTLTGTKNYLADITGQYNSRADQLHRVACKELPLFVKP